jgi:hypothetical protein
MRRGFKKDAREIATELRAELDLGPYAPLDPWALAAHLEIPVWPLSSYRQMLPESTDLLMSVESGAFSGMLAFVGPRRVIIHNDAHASTRQRSDIGHELAHALLLHRPDAMLGGVFPRFDAEQEDEATWLGGVLLVSDQFCVQCARGAVPLAVAAESMGVSLSLMRWRYNMSGARRRATRPPAVKR